MSYVRPNAYTTGTPIDGGEVRENHESLRTWVNRGVRAADISGGNVDYNHILAGEYASVTKDHRFTTGWHYSVAFSSDFAQQSAVGLSMKFSPDDLLLMVPVIAKKVRATVADSMALVTAYLQMIPEAETVDEVASSIGSADLAYLFVDGVKVAESKAPFFAGTESNSPADGSDAGGSLASRLRVATFHTLVAGLDAGMHDIELRVNPWHTLSLVRARSLNVEMFEV